MPEEDKGWRNTDSCHSALRFEVNHNGKQAKEILTSCKEAYEKNSHDERNGCGRKRKRNPGLLQHILTVLGVRISKDSYQLNAY